MSKGCSSTEGVPKLNPALSWSAPHFSQGRGKDPQLPNCLKNREVTVSQDVSTGKTAVLPALLPSCRGLTHRDVGKGRTSRLCCSTSNFLEILSGSQRQIWSHLCLCDLQRALGIQLSLLKYKETKN